MIFGGPDELPDEVKYEVQKSLSYIANCWREKKRKEVFGLVPEEEEEEDLVSFHFCGDR